MNRLLSDFRPRHIVLHPHGLSRTHHIDHLQCTRYCTSTDGCAPVPRCFIDTPWIWCSCPERRKSALPLSKRGGLLRVPLSCFGQKGLPREGCGPPRCSSPTSPVQTSGAIKLGPSTLGVKQSDDPPDEAFAISSSPFSALWLRQHHRMIDCIKGLACEGVVTAASTGISAGNRYAVQGFVRFFVRLTTSHRARRPGKAHGGTRED